MKTKKYFKDSELSVDAFEKKYKIGDEEYEDAIERVVDNVAKMEGFDNEWFNNGKLNFADITKLKKYEYWKERWKKEILNDVWKPAGSIMAGVGNPIKNISTANCFSGDTEFITDLGVKAFTDFKDGDDVNILVNTGKFVQAKVKYFGNDKLYKIVFGKNGLYKEVYTTKDHRWRVFDKNVIIEKTTIELNVGDYIPYIKRKFLKSKDNKRFIDPFGFVYGFVFGDGYYDKRNNECKVSLFGDKKELVDYFNGYKIRKYNDSIIIRKLPTFMKEMPNFTNINKEFILGFIVGWFASDGSVSKDGKAVLYHNNLYNLKVMKSILETIGIYTSEIKTMRDTHNVTIMGKEYNNKIYKTYRLYFTIDSMFKEFFVRKKHLNNYNYYIKNKTIYNYAKWRVLSVEETERIEPVYCVQVPKYENFTLSGGLNTKNCSTISINGDTLEDIAETRYKLMKFAAYRQGIGLDFSNLRPAGAKIGNSAKVSDTGALNWMEDFNEAARHVGQSGRVPALLYSLHDTHPDFPEFITAKSDLKKIENANISIQMSDAFMRAVENDEDWEMTFQTPHETIVRKEKARELYEKTLKNNLDFSEPGIQFRDTVHRYSNSDYVGWPVVSSNACFTGSMKLLTEEGYKRFDKLSGLSAKIINKAGVSTNGGIWFSGVKHVVEIMAKDDNDKFYTIEVTPDQLFLLEKNVECEAKDLFMKKVKIKDGYAKVLSIRYVGKKAVYDFSEPVLNWGFVNDFVVHNCSEKFLDPSGVCNLASFNLEKFPTDKTELNNYLADYAPSIVRFLDNVIDYEIYSNRAPLEEQVESQRALRRLGIGFLNLHAWLLKAGVDYGSEESIELVEYLAERLMYHTYRASIELGKEKGSFLAFDKTKFEQSPYVDKMMKLGLKFNTMRNVETLAIAPNGTTALMISKPVFSYGIEPAFGLYYWKRTRISGHYEYYFVVPNVVYEILKENGIDLKKKGLKALTVKDTFDGIIGKPIAKIIDANKHLFNFKPAKDIKPEDKIKLMSAVAKYIDSSISTTYILPETATIKDIDMIIKSAWKNGIKSVSVYRDATRYGIIEFIPFKERVEQLYKEGYALHEHELSEEDVKMLSFNPFENKKYSMVIDNSNKDMSKIFKFKAEGGDKFYIILRNDEKQIFIINYKIENRSNERILSIANKLGALIKEVNEKEYYKQLERSENTLNRFTRMLSTALKLDLKDKALEILDEYAIVGNLAWYLTKRIFNYNKDIGQKCPICNIGTMIPTDDGCSVCDNCGYSKCE